MTRCKLTVDVADDSPNTVNLAVGDMSVAATNGNPVTFEAVLSDYGASVAVS